MIDIDQIFTRESMTVYESIANSFVSKYNKLIYPGSSEDVLAELHCTLITERDYYENRAIDIDLKYLVWIAKRRLIDTFILGRDNRNDTNYRPFIFELIRTNGRAYLDAKQLIVANLEIYQVADMFARIDKRVSLGLNISSDHTAVLFTCEFGINDNRYDEIMSKLCIDSLIAILTDKELFIIKSLFIDGYNQLELAKMLHCTRSWISQRSRLTFEKIRRCLERDRIEDMFF